SAALPQWTWRAGTSLRSGVPESAHAAERLPGPELVIEPADGIERRGPRRSGFDQLAEKVPRDSRNPDAWRCPGPERLEPAAVPVPFQEVAPVQPLRRNGMVQHGFRGIPDLFTEGDHSLAELG